MNTDKKTIYTVSISIFAILLFALFIPVENIKLVFMVLTAGLAAGAYFLIKKRSVLDMNKGLVSFLLLLIGVLFVVLLYATGVAYGYYKSVYKLSFNNILKYIIPISVIIVSTELIRSILLQQKDKYVTVLAYLIGVIIDLVIFTNLNFFTRFESFMHAFGLMFLPSLTFNFMYCYISRNFGMKPNVIFRLIFTLYSYIIPVVPAVPEVFETIIRFILPLLIFFFIRGLFNKDRKYAMKHKGNVISFISLCIVLVLMTSLVMLISCEFKYGMIVVGSGSMSGELEVGDAIVYEEYTNQFIDVGDILVFKKDDVLVIHRVVEKTTINGVVRYITKGDANESEDAGYITKSDIVGITKLRILYIGYPSILVRKLFN